MSVILRNPAVEPSWLRNLYPWSTQNIDDIFSTISPNLDVNCLLYYYLEQPIFMLFQLLGRYGESNNVNDDNNNNVNNITV